MTRAVRYLNAKPGADGPRYYWEPGPMLRKFGWTTRRLANGYAAAAAQAEVINAEVDRWRREGGPVRKSAAGTTREKRPREAVYVIGPFGGPVKIGRSRRPEKRLSPVANGTHVGGSELWFVFRHRLITGARLERAVHAELASRRVNGEWFAVDAWDAQCAILRVATSILQGAKSDGRGVRTRNTKSDSQSDDPAGTPRERRASG